jgi:hypothetical protein
MKSLKRILKISLISLLVILGVLIAAPFLFQDKIKAALSDALNRQLNAEVYFADLGLSFLRHFPKVSITLEDFGVVGKGPFAGDSLIRAGAMILQADLSSVLSGSQVNLSSLELDQAKVYLKVLADGTANWDITLPDTATVADSAPESELLIQLQRYAIRRSELIYDDASLPMYLHLRGLDHNGKGDFTATNFDLRTATVARGVDIAYDGLTYVENGALAGQVDMNIDIKDALILRFLPSEAQLNALRLSLAGEISMPGDDIVLDLTYATRDNDIRSLLSLVPGVYTQDFDDIRTEGTFDLEGSVKGTYNDRSFPGFGLDMAVTNGQIQYPDLPQPIKNLSLDLSVQEPDGTFENTLIDLRSLHADLGPNPIDGKVKVQGLERMAIAGNLKTQLKLEELGQFVPLQGTQLRGLFKLDATAKGVYDEAKNQFPQVDALMSLQEGFVKSPDYPTEISDLRFEASLKEADQDLRRAVFDMPNFHFLLDGEPLDGSLRVQDFSDPQYELQAHGQLDLAKLMQLYPMEGVEMAGKLVIENLKTQGRMSAIEQERYTDLPTSGTLRIENLSYEDKELGPPITLSQGTASFGPDRLEISDAQGTLGSSDYQLSGAFNNYLAYALLEDQPLSGDLRFASKKFDLNEWLTEEEAAPEASPGEEVPLEVVPIPKGIELDVDARIDEVLYDTYTLKKLAGQLKVADQRLNMENVTFDLLGSNMQLSGYYDTQNPEKPGYAFLMDARELQIVKAVREIPGIQQFAPATRLVEGSTNTSFAISGKLKKDYTPILEDITSEGFFEVLQGSLSNNKIFDLLAKVTQLDELKKLDLSGAKGWFEIANGIIEVKPFDLKTRNAVITLGGTQSLSGDLNYSLDLDMPAGKVSQAAMSSLSKLAGTSLEPSERVQMSFTVGGTVEDPKIQNARSNTANQLKDELADKASQALKDRTGVDVKVDSVGKQLKDLQQAAKDSARLAAERAKQAAVDSAKAVLEKEKQKAKEKLEEELKKQLGDDAKDKLDELKNKLKFPKKKKN